MVAFASEFPKTPRVDVNQADLGLTAEETLRAWQSEGMELLAAVQKEFQAGEISQATYLELVREMSKMARHRRNFEKLLFGEELK